MKSNKTSQIPLYLLVCVLLIASGTIFSGCKWGTTPEDEGHANFSLRFYPSEVEIVGEGQIATVDVMVDNASSLIAAHFTVSYDPHIVEVTKVKTSGFGLLFSDDGVDVQEIENSIDNDNGLVTIGIGAFQSGYTGSYGSGSLAIITFKSRKQGDCAMEFLNDSDDDLITGIYSSRHEKGWIDLNAIIYNSTITVTKEKKPEPEPEPGDTETEPDDSGTKPNNS